MATALASQLQALAAPGTQSFSKTKTRPSILFDAQQAADIDIATIFSLALAGLEELGAMDSRFGVFRKTLFSLESCQLDRELQGKDFNQKLNTSMRSYLCLLSDYLLLGPAHQTLEYLIRRYNIHLHNVDDLIKFILPYHETSLFVRIVQLSQIEKTRWHFLEGVKKSGAAPPRGLLVQQCVRDMAVVEALCESGHTLEVAGTFLRPKAAFSFSAAMVLEVLAAVQVVESPFLNRVIPYIVQCFEKGSYEETQIGGLMIIGALAFKTNLSEETVVLFFDLLARLLNSGGAGSKVPEMVVLVMVQLLQTQTLTTFPQKAFKSIVKVRQLPETLCRLNKKFHAENFLSLFIKSLAQHCLVSPHYVESLKEMIDKVPLEDHVEQLVTNLLNLSCEITQLKDSPPESTQTGDLKTVFFVLEDRFPDKLDKAINGLLESLSRNDIDRRDRIAAFVNCFLDKSLHSVMAASNQTIYMSLDHPEARKRCCAVENAAIVARNNSKMQAICEEALLIRLEDEDLSVVRAVLSVEGLTKLIKPDQLLASQVSILSRCAKLLVKGSRTSKGEAKSAAKLCLQFMGTDFLNTFPSYAPRVGQVFLGMMLPCSKTWKLNLMAVRLAKNIKWGLFEGLSFLEEKTLRPDVRVEKEARILWMHEIGCKVILSLSKAVHENPGSLLDLTAYASNHEQTKPVVLLVLLQALKRPPRGLQWEVVEGFLAFLKQEWATVESVETFPVLQITDAEMSTEDALPLTMFKMLQRQPEVAYYKLVHWCFYQVLVVMPSLDSQQEAASLNMLEDMFVVFSSAQSRANFEEHLKLLLRKISFPHVLFLSRFFNAEGGAVPLPVQVYSLNILSRDLMEMDELNAGVRQLALPYLMVAMSNPVKAVRKAAIECISTYYGWCREAASKQSDLIGSGGQPTVLPLSVLKKFLELLSEYRSSFVSSGDFVRLFISAALGQPSNHKETTSGAAVSHRLKHTDQRCLLLFLLQAALQMPAHMQCTLLVALEEAGDMSDQAVVTKGALDSLLYRWKNWKSKRSSESKLSRAEFDLFKHLLKVRLLPEGILSSIQEDLSGKEIWFETLMEVTSIVEGATDNDIIEVACVALSCLDNRVIGRVDELYQDAIFEQLIVLSKLNMTSLQTASRHAMHAIDVDEAAVSRYIDEVLHKLSVVEDKPEQGGQEDVFAALNCLGTVSEFLVSKPNLGKMGKLTTSLFTSLQKISNLCHSKKGVNVENQSAQIGYTQQLLLEALERYAKATDADDTNAERYDIDYLVEFIHGTTDIGSRNQALSLLATLGQRMPDMVLEHVIRIFSVLGETTLIQDDNHSYLVTEKLISAVVPGWLERYKDPGLLLQILVKALPQIPSHRRSPLLRTTLRLMEESASLHVLLLLLLNSSLAPPNAEPKSSQKRANNSSRKALADLDTQAWCCEFSSNICEQYEPSISLPALLSLLQACQVEDLHDELERSFALQAKVVEFILSQLQKSGLSVQLESVLNDTDLKAAFLGLLEEVLSFLQKSTINPPNKKKTFDKMRAVVQEKAHLLLESITSMMSPTLFADGMSRLLESSAKNMKIRVLCLITKKMNETAHKTEAGSKLVSTQYPSDVYEKLVGEVAVLINNQSLETGSMDLTLAAISAMHSCSRRLAAKLHAVFVSNLPVLIACCQRSVSIAPASLECIASIIAETGPVALPVLSELMKSVISTASKHVQRGKMSNGIHGGEPINAADMSLALLSVLDSVIQKLGNFLSPYLKDILDLLMVQPWFLLNANKLVAEKADAVRSLIPKAIPARLLLDPLVEIYEQTLERGELSTLACIEVLSLLVSSMDKGSVLSHYKTVFNVCLKAFDLRRRPPESFKSVTVVEMSAISLFTQLVLKLSESTFKPLFVKVLEWAETNVLDGLSNERSTQNVHRSIVFYRLVNQLADKLRSVFVPYFQYFLKACVHHLANAEDGENSKRKKKQKTSSQIYQGLPNEGLLSNEEWHLRQLIVSSLHKCFLYDTANFLDTQKFQMLLGPLVRQLTVEGPANVCNCTEWIPSRVDMDNTLVACLGQMAITAGTDLLWKPLNHEVLLCTRNESVHVRMLSLEIIKFLVDNLKEDYLVLLPETIPFLAELLEDEDLNVVSKSQQIIKVLEELSGESLSQYL